MNEKKKLIPWSHRKLQPVLEYPVVYAATGLACPKCAKEIYRNTSMTYTTNPAKFQYVCLEKDCDFKEVC